MPTILQSLFNLSFALLLASWYYTLLLVHVHLNKMTLLHVDIVYTIKSMVNSKGRSADTNMSQSRIMTTVDNMNFHVSQKDKKQINGYVFIIQYLKIERSTSIQKFTLRCKENDQDKGERKINHQNNTGNLSNQMTSNKNRILPQQLQGRCTWQNTQVISKR